MSKFWRDKIFHAQEVEKKDFLDMLNTILTYEPSTHKLILGASRAAISTSKKQQLTEVKESKEGIEDSQLDKSEASGEKEEFTLEELRAIQKRTLQESQATTAVETTEAPKRKLQEIVKAALKSKQQTTSSTSTTVNEEKAKKRKEDSSYKTAQPGLVKFTIPQRFGVQTLGFSKRIKKQKGGQEKGRE
jgi:glucan-binding YG repeat protein